MSQRIEVWRRRLWPSFGGMAGAVAHGGGGASQSFQSTSSNTSSTSGPHPFIQPTLKSIGSRFSDLFSQNMEAPAYYPGSTVAPQSERTQSALTALWQRGASGLGGLDTAARQMAQNTLSGKYLDADSNPYWQDALAASFRPQNEQFASLVAPKLAAQFAGAGRYGSGAHVDAIGRAYGELAQSQSDAAAKTAANLYGSERDRMVNAAGLLPQFQALDYRNLEALMQAGAAQDAYAQRVIDADVDRYNYGVNAPYDWLVRGAQGLQSIMPGGSTSGSSSGFSHTYVPQPDNTLQQILGGIMGAAGTGAKAYMMSDARLKDVAGRVGATDEGVPLYLYSYRGDDQPRIGPMAQEVAHLRPDAVARHPSGYLMVDYASLAPRGGLL
ncbi:MAG: hypothetical protein ACOY4R_31400 [Pseudomonadota bacterium]